MATVLLSIFASKDADCDADQIPKEPRMLWLIDNYCPIKANKLKIDYVVLSFYSTCSIRLNVVTRNK